MLYTAAAAHSPPFPSNLHQLLIDTALPTYRQWPLLPISTLSRPRFASSLPGLPPFCFYHLALPGFTASLTGHLPLPTSPLSSSAAAPTPASITPIPSTSHTPAAPQLPPYISNKIPALPKQLIDSILAWDYIDLSDLLPEQLRVTTPGTFSPGKEVVVVPELSWDTRRRKKRQIVDIATWIEVFSIYILVLSSRFPEFLPNLISYQLTIVKLSKRFRYPSWLYYDVEYRKWAAANRIQDWS